MPFTLLNEHVARMNVEIIGGRAETAPGLNYLRPEPWAEDAANDGYESRTTDRNRAAEADRMVSCEILCQERAKSQAKIMEASSFAHGSVASPCVAPQSRGRQFHVRCSGIPAHCKALLYDSHY